MLRTKLMSMENDKTMNHSLPQLTMHVPTHTHTQVGITDKSYGCCPKKHFIESYIVIFKAIPSEIEMPYTIRFPFSSAFFTVIFLQSCCAGLPLFLWPCSSLLAGTLWPCMTLIRPV